jgi:hypothetical protein
MDTMKDPDQEPVRSSTAKRVGARRRTAMNTLAARVNFIGSPGIVP